MSLENSLLALLPTHASATLPPQLTSLATALYAQSRSKVSTLKPDEEIARGYACAELAAQRLKGKLNLSKIHSTPPCSPKVYKKLYGFLDGVLTAKVPPRQGKTSNCTPTKGNNSEEYRYSTPIKAPKSITARSTSTKRAPGTNPELQDLASGATETPSKRQKISKEKPESSMDSGKDVPEWIPRAIRYFCKRYEAPEAIPHVYVGVVTVSKLPDSGLALGSRAKRDETIGAQPAEKIKYCSLVIAILFIVLDRMLGIVPDMEMVKDSVHELIGLRLVTPRQTGEVTLGIKKMLEDKTEGWREMEWFDNIGNNNGPVSADVGIGQDSDDDLDQAEQPGSVITSKVDAARAADVPMYGLGTMMQARTDWLSDERRALYRRWRVKMIKWIEDVEHQQARLQHVR